jgi:hypothetical protein
VLGRLRVLKESGFPTSRDQNLDNEEKAMNLLSCRSIHGRRSRHDLNEKS